MPVLFGKVSALQYRDMHRVKVSGAYHVVVSGGVVFGTAMRLPLCVKQKHGAIRGQRYYHCRCGGRHARNRPDSLERLVKETGTLFWFLVFVSVRQLQIKRDDAFWIKTRADRLDIPEAFDQQARADQQGQGKRDL